MKTSQRHCGLWHPLISHLLRGRAAGVLLLAILWYVLPLRCDAAILAGPTVNPSNGHTYYLLTSSSWTAAQAEAVSLGGNLVTINDASENYWVYQTYQPLMPSIESGGGALWIGLYAPAGDDQFVWVSGESATYRNFQPGQPGKLGDENYVHIWGPTSTATQPLVWGQWNNLVDSGWPIPCFGVVEIDGPAAPPPGGYLTSDASGPLNPGRQTIHFTLDLNGTLDLSRVRETTTSPNLVLERGGNRMAIGALVDDGLHGDGAARDSVFGLSVDLDVEPSTSYSFIASTAYRGRAARKFSDAVELASRALTPEESCAHAGGTWHTETQTCCLPGSDACCGNPDPCCGSTDPACSGNPLLVGVGIHDITGPAGGGGMMGYQKSEQTAAGIRDRQWARAFIAAGRNSGDKRVIFVVADTGQIFHSVTQGVHDMLQGDDVLREYYSYENMVISATHTHGAASGSSHYPAYNLGVGGYQWQTYDALVHGIFTAIKKAHYNLKPGRILMNSGNLMNANENRTADAFQKNDELSSSSLGNPFGSDDRDTGMLCLRFEQEDRNGGRTEVGMLNWFPVHGTSFGNMNQLLTGDNKGYASYLFERDKGLVPPGKPHPGGLSKFVAGFANSNAGDLRPNLFNFDPNWPATGVNDLYRAKTIGARQYVAAKQLYEGSVGVQSPGSGLPAYLDGIVDYKHMYVAMSNVMVNPIQCYPFNHLPNTRFSAVGNSTQYRTFPGATGKMMLWGNPLEGPGNGLAIILGNLWPGLSLVTGDYLHSLNTWHAPKDVYLSTGTSFGLPSPFGVDLSKLASYSWMPQILPVSILRIGNLAIIAVPAELTTMAGLRLRKSVEEMLGSGYRTVIAGYANDYSSYVTTYEEYNYLRPPDPLGLSGIVTFVDHQTYEAGSTQFGPYTLMAYQTVCSELARCLRDGNNPNTLPMPRSVPFGEISEWVFQPLFANDPGVDRLPPFPSRPAEFKGKAFAACPDGQFFDPIDGGTCWSCPNGYERTLFFGVDTDRACERPAEEVFAAAIDNGPSGCGPGQFPDSGACWSCPNGYQRTLFFGVSTDHACERGPRTLRAAPDSILPPPPAFGSCPAGYTFDFFGQACFRCPAGYVRTILALRSGDACERVEAASWTSATRHGLFPCQSGSGTPGESDRCWSCPGGYNHVFLRPWNVGNACVRVIEPQLTGATRHGAYPCQSGSGTPGESGKCWSCPEGFEHVFLRPWNVGNACQRVIAPAWAGATKHGALSCEGRGREVGESWFLDLGRGECWTCHGWNRSLLPVTDSEACFGSMPNFGEAISDSMWRRPDHLRQYKSGEVVSIGFWGGHPKNVFGSPLRPTLDSVPTFFEIQRFSNGVWETVRTDADWDTTLEWIPTPQNTAEYSTFWVSWTIGADAPLGGYKIVHRGQYLDQYSGEFKNYSGESPLFWVVP